MREGEVRGAEVRGTAQPEPRTTHHATRNPQPETRTTQHEPRNPNHEPRKKMSYRDLEIYQEAFRLFLQLHPASLKLPKFELYEQGSQVRRSADSVVSNIVEGYGRRRNRTEYIRFLVFSHSSNDETLNHLKKLGILYPEQQEFKELEEQYNVLGAKINKYIQYVEKNWK